MIKNIFVKREKYFYFSAMIFFALLILLLFIISITEIYQLREFSPTLLRYIKSVNFVSKNLPIGILGFGTWSFDLSNQEVKPIYLSYPNSS